MIVAKGNYAYTIQAISGSASGAAYLGDTDLLFDGRPGTPCSTQWVSGAQTTSSYVLLSTRVTAVTGSVSALRIFALLGVEDLPEGLVVQLVTGASHPPTTVRGTGVLTADDDGTTMKCVFLLDTGVDDAYFGFKLFNNVAGASPVLASTEFVVGELYARSAYELNAATIEDDLEDPSITNFAGGNQAYPVMLDPYPVLNVTLAPHRSFSEAFIGTDNLKTMRRELLTQPYVFVIWRPNPRAGATDQDHVDATSMMCRCTSFRGVTSDASTDRWGATIAFQGTL